MSHDPLARWSAFHPRWFEVFDLDHGLRVETSNAVHALLPSVSALAISPAAIA